MKRISYEGLLNPEAYEELEFVAEWEVFAGRILSPDRARYWFSRLGGLIQRSEAERCRLVMFGGLGWSQLLIWHYRLGNRKCF